MPVERNTPQLVKKGKGKKSESLTSLIRLSGTKSKQKKKKGNKSRRRK